MKKILYTLIFFIIAFSQTSLFPVIFGKAFVVDAVLMLILAWSIIDGFFAFLGWAVFFGVVYDFLSYSRIGVHVLIFLATLYFVSFFSRRFTVDMKGIGIILFLLFVVVISFFSHLIIAGATALDLHTLQGFWKSFGSYKNFFIELLFNSILFFIMFLLIKKTKSFFMLEK